MEPCTPTPRMPRASGGATSASIARVVTTDCLGSVATGGRHMGNDSAGSPSSCPVLVFDHRHHRRPDGPGQPRPRGRDMGQAGVHGVRIAAKCAGFRAVFSVNVAFRRGLGGGVQVRSRPFAPGSRGGIARSPRDRATTDLAARHPAGRPRTVARRGQPAPQDEHESRRRNEKPASFRWFTGAGGRERDRRARARPARPGRERTRGRRRGPSDSPPRRSSESHRPPGPGRPRRGRPRSG